MSGAPVGVLFVCLGNICRSPLAEAVFRDLVRRAKLDDRIEIDSAGTGSWHVGEPPDRRTREVARRRGVEVDGRARKVTGEDAERFDYLVAMDRENLDVVRRLASRVRDRGGVFRLREFDPDAAGDLDVPDPYYGGPNGFELVHDIVERSCQGLLEHIRSENGL